MNPAQRELDGTTLTRWERLRLDPDWDTAKGSPKPAHREGKQQDDDKETTP